MEFERELVALEAKLGELKRLDLVGQPEIAEEIALLVADVEKLRRETYTNLSPWERVQISRHPERPKTQDFLENVFSDVIELHGDRLFGDDEAIFAGLATFGDRRCAVIGHRKGKDTKENIRRNFGSPHPEGFRKAMRMMKLAEKFHLPLVTFLDTAGAYPGLEAEERGQAWAIAECLATLAELRTPVVVVGIGEGGSGGALAIGYGDRVIMLENAYYSVSSPEACASIVHKDAGRAADVAGSLCLTASDLVRLGIADEIVAEPLGGAHSDPGSVYEGVRSAIDAALGEVCGLSPDELVAERYGRIRKTGVVSGAE